eukprot:4458838-Ditylum_brightwellii.AAC.1
MAKPMAPVLYQCTYWVPNFYTQSNHCSQWGQPCPLGLQNWPNTELQHYLRPHYMWAFPFHPSLRHHRDYRIKDAGRHQVPCTTC